MKTTITKNITVMELVGLLEIPDNEEQIKRLEELSELRKLDELKQMRGLGGLFARFIMKFTNKHQEGLIALSECRTTYDIVAFKQTQHYNNIKNARVEMSWDFE
ncbi:MAG: hypothetical protein FWC95_05480 [Defluviitaleaceae bacterium]|nr:hypothetical protein [Defluviitaleaceae bacterium]